MADVQVGTRIRVLIAPLQISGISARGATQTGAVPSVDDAAGTVTVKLGVSMSGEELMIVRADQVSPY